MLKCRIGDRDNTFGNCHAGQLGAAVKDGATCRAPACGEVDAFQVTTVHERIAVDGRNAIRQFDIRKAGTAIECVASDGKQTVGKGETCQSGAVLECIATDGGQPIGEVDRA